MAVDAKRVKDTKDKIAEMERDMDMEELMKDISVVTVKLSKPFSYQDEVYTEIKMDFEGLTGREVESIDAQLQTVGDYMVTQINPYSNHKYQRYFAAAAAGVPSDMLEALPMRDYNKITKAAQDFLFATR